MKVEIVLGALAATAFWVTVAVLTGGTAATLKDVVGPLSTVIAASVAAWIAYAIGRGQLAVARSQADIAQRNWQTANERVVLDLIERRITIYDDVRKVIAMVMATGKPQNAEHLAFAEATDRAAFYFGVEVTEYLERMRIVIIDLEHSNIMIATNDPEGPKLHYDRMIELYDFYKAAPRLLGPYIRAHQKVTAWS